ncbi:MAG: alpha-1,4-glucan--maltose-1-phosphate maltosyltransferase [Bacteroidetes bacterium]|nr:alpha-1,4-glucan--maltose-1-phosphate maltosyltransferase [Bacteroidota bacterium]
MPGRKRVVISNVSPSVDGGIYPAKAIIDRPLTISADIFSDGHDHIAAALFIRHKDEKQWKELPLQFKNNDCWETVITPTKLGIYEFQVSGWIDKVSTWQADLRKRYDAGQDVSTDIRIGIQLAEGLQKAATGKNKATIQNWISRLNTEKDPELRVGIATETGFAELARKCRDKNAVTVSDATYEITVDRELAGFSNWYELFPRSASREEGKHGSFDDVVALLPRVERMGFNILYLPPIHPIGQAHRKGRNNSLHASAEDPGSPWAIGNKRGGHKAIHNELGNLKDFKRLIAESRKYNIEIAMDIAYQCSPDHPYLKEHPKWFKWRPDGTVQYAENPPKRYEDIVPFDFETEDWESLWEELKSIIDYWIEAGVTVFRVDNPHTKAFPFWEWMIGEVKAEHPEVIFLAEAFTRPRLMEQLGKIGFTQSYTYFAWRNTKWELEQYVKELTQAPLKYYFRPNFWPNTPDILTEELVNGKENAHVIRLLLAATLSSSYGIYGPVYEYNVADATPGKEEYIDNEKYEIKHWDWDKHTKTFELICRMNRIRKEHPALQVIDNIQFLETNNEQLIAYLKVSELHTDTLITVINLDPYNVQSGHIKLPPALINKEIDESFVVHDLLGGDTYQWQGEWHFVSLNPYDIPAHILQLKQ